MENLTLSSFQSFKFWFAMHFHYAICLSGKHFIMLSGVWYYGECKQEFFFTIDEIEFYFAGKWFPLSNCGKPVQIVRILNATTTLPPTTRTLPPPLPCCHHCCWHHTTTAAIPPPPTPTATVVTTGGSPLPPPNSCSCLAEFY